MSHGFVPRLRNIDLRMERRMALVNLNERRRDWKGWMRYHNGFLHPLNGWRN